jgi:hypothetical protein
MNKKDRKIALAKLTKEAALNKIAEDAISDVNQANIEDPQQFADKIFQEILNNMKIEGLDE